jgi:hypothetical protein
METVRESARRNSQYSRQDHGNRCKQRCLDSQPMHRSHVLTPHQKIGALFVLTGHQRCGQKCRHERADEHERAQDNAGARLGHPQLAWDGLRVARAAADGGDPAALVVEPP